MKSFDLEKLQSLTLSGEKITKEIFDAAFINNSPYYFANHPTDIYSMNYSHPMGYEESAMDQQRRGDGFNIRSYDIFREAFDTAASGNKSATTIQNDYQSNYYY